MDLNLLLPLLACPLDLSPLTRAEVGLVCDRGHNFGVVDDIPILVRGDVPQTHWAATHALEVASGTTELEPYQADAGIDPFVQGAIGATGGYMYGPMIGRLNHYPIPELPFDPGHGEWLLDVGCNWGRWTIAAARHGYRAVGMDPSLEGIRAAQRVSRQLGVDVALVVGDARYPPFRNGVFARALSYSVLQHFSKTDAATALAATGRVLSSGGVARVQMPNAFGIRSLYRQALRGFRTPRAFQVRYWTASELQRTFERAIGPATVSIDGFFSLNAQPAEAHLLPRRYQFVVGVSNRLKALSAWIPALRTVADSFWVTATRR